MSVCRCALGYVQRLVAFAIGLVFAALASVRLAWIIVKNPRKLLNRKDHSQPPSCLSDPGLGTHGFVHLEAVRLHYVVSGQEGRPLMLFLHGFPEFWYSWRFQIREFQKDYRVVAVDMRGYADSDKPQGVQNYRVSAMVKDIHQLIPALGYDRCTLVGHDWGAAISYSFATRYPDMVERLIVMNCPHPRAFRPYLTSHLAQFSKSWYMFFFQVPYLPEFYLRLNDYAAVWHIFKGRHGVKHDTVTEEDVQAYKYALSKEGGLTGPINYIRAMFSTQSFGIRKGTTVSVPALLIWGCQDMALETGLAQATSKYMDQLDISYIEEASHWVQMDTPDKVNQIMREWLQRQSS